jgi:hypothetical protein
MKVKRSHALVVLLGLGVTGIVGVSAASLGGVTSDELGAQGGVVAACDEDGVTVSYSNVSYNQARGYARVTDVTLGGVAAECVAQAVEVTLLDVNGDELGQGTAVAASPDTVVSISGNPDAEDVVGVYVVISG